MEHKEQCTVARYLRAKRLLHTCSLAGLRLSMGQLAKAKNAGYTKGTPDLIIFEPVGNYHGLMIEMKRAERSKAKVSEDQKLWLAKAKERGYYACVCYGADEAINMIDIYLGGDCEC